jgi:alkylation response protein AidB-like acyl-CoA dehydrogenase
VNLDYSPEDLAFRDEVRAFIAAEYPAELRAKQDAGEELNDQDFLSWHRILAKRAWSAPAWPVEYGGPGLSQTRRFLMSEEMAAADTVPVLPFGVHMVGPVIYTFGTPEQKARWLPPTLAGDIWWCQGYSEPGAGSDLASLKTRAVRGVDAEGEHYIVNGQKTWTTLAQFADWGFFLVRTDPDAKQQAGISFLLIDMKSPGITVRPIITLDGSHEVNEVWLEDVRVPVENRIFKENEGWTCAKFLLAHERTGIAGVARAKRGLEKLRKVAAAEGVLDDPVFEAELADLEIDLLALEYSELRTLGPRERRQGPGSGILPAQDQGHRDPAASDRDDGRGARRLRPARRTRSGECGSGRPRLRRSRRADLFQHAQGLDLRRLERDPAQHHRQDGPGALR